MKIAVVGAGYVGLVTGACLARLGHAVTCLDLNEARIALLNAGRCPIHEDGLEALIRQGLRDGQLAFTTDAPTAIAGAELVFVCVGTPPRPDDGQSDLSQIFSAVTMIADMATRPLTLVVKSTVPVGTCDEIEQLITTRGAAAHIDVAFNPEFLREGSAVRDFMEPERIVFGSQSPVATAALRSLYSDFLEREVPVVVSSRRTAELIKYAANCFLALKVTYINEIANLCEAIGADVTDLSHAIGLDSRIGNKFLQPGPGFGGSCFPKDMLALSRTAQDNGVAMRLVETSMAVNDVRKGEMVRKIAAAVGGNLSGKSVAIWGLTFKAHTDDMRTAVSLVIIPQLLKAGARISAFDPVGMPNAAQHFPTVHFARSAIEAAQAADVLVVLTEWPEFRDVAPAALRAVMQQPVVVDMRNLLDGGNFARHGFDFVSIGRPALLGSQTHAQPAQAEPPHLRRQYSSSR